MAESTIAATLEEAIENAGTTVLSLDTSPLLRLRHHGATVDEVTEFEEQTKGTVLGYAGPYTDEEDERNSWTAYREPPPVIP